MPLLIAALLLSPVQTGGLTLQPSKIAFGVRPVALAAAPTGSNVAVAMEDGSVSIIDAATRGTIRPLAKHLQAAYGIAWSADGAIIATGDETARLFIEDARTGKKIKEYRTHTKGIQKVSINCIRDRVLTTGKDDTIKVYSPSSDLKKEVLSIPGQGANFYGAAFSPKLPYTFSTGILGNGGRLYDAKTGSVTGFFVGHGNQGVFDAAYNPAGTRMVTSGRDSTAIVWDPIKQKKIGTLMGHTDWVELAAFSPNGKYIATSSTDRNVILWNAVTLQKVAVISNETAVGSPLAFTADGKYLVSVNDAGFLQVTGLTPAQPAPPAASSKAKKPAKTTRRRHRG